MDDAYLVSFRHPQINNLAAIQQAKGSLKSGELALVLV